MARNWDGLSDSYRKRLGSHGIDRSQYESGASLSAARGHGLTRDALIDHINLFKTEQYGHKRTWDAEKSRKHIDRNEDGEKRTVAELKAIHKSYVENRSVNRHGNPDYDDAAIWNQLREDDLEDAGFYK